MELFNNFKLLILSVWERGILGVDIFEILKVASTKPFGFRPFHPRPGIGGHCIPIDPHYLYWKAKKRGVNANFIKLSAETNSSVIKFIFKKYNQKIFY